MSESQNEKNIFVETLENLDLNYVKKWVKMLKVKDGFNKLL